MIMSARPLISLLKKAIAASFLLNGLIVSTCFAHASFEVKSCQLLLAPTQQQYSDYFKKQLLEFNHLRFRLSVLLQAPVFNRYSRDLQMMITLSPLQYFFEFHREILGSSGSIYTYALGRTGRLFEKSFGQAIFQHPAGANERGQLLRFLFSKMRGLSFFDPPFLDEVLGLNKPALEASESKDFLKAVPAEEVLDLSKPTGIGLAAGHDFWFSRHRNLFMELELATYLGAKRIVDLGCGTGRLGLIAGLMFPKIKFIGLEIYAPRIEAAQQAAKRFGFSDRIQFRVQDLLDAEKEIPVADYYYVYGPTNSPSMNSAVIDRLEPIAKGHFLYISSKHWDTTGDLRRRTWLRPLTDQPKHPSYLFTNQIAKGTP